jgi:cell division protein FtsQ
LEKLRTMDADAYPQEVLADEEPKYLRRQKPLEIKRRKFGKKAWKTYLRVTFWCVIALAAAATSYALGHYLLVSPEMALVHSDQVQVTGNQFVPKGRVLEVFSADRNRSVLRIALNERRRQLETIPWVEQATVRRALPNRIEVEIIERTPIAFLRETSDLALVDVHGVILDRPLKANFHFPVITGIGADMPIEERELRMQMFAGFSQQVEAARAGAMEQVSEVDLTEAKDLRATISGLQVTNTSSGGAAGNDAWGNADAPIVVHFGDSDFQSKYLTVLNDIGQWRAAAGRVESVDLRFNGEAVVNPDRTILALKKDPPPITTVAPTASAPRPVAPAQPAVHPAAPAKSATPRKAAAPSKAAAPAKATKVVKATKPAKAKTASAKAAPAKTNSAQHSASKSSAKHVSSQQQH